MPINTYANPSRKEAAQWASSVEFHLGRRFPGLSLKERRNLPMMQGTYRHLLAHEKGLELPWPATPEGLAALDEVDRDALLSQYFLGLATLNLAAAATGDDFYNNTFLPIVRAVDDKFDIRQFSTDDLIGFASCVLVWMKYYGGNLASWEVSLAGKLALAIADHLDLTPEQREQFRQFIAEAEALLPTTTFQYRDASQYPGYTTLPLENNALVVMLGDWGTGMEDAAAFLEALWRSAFLQSVMIQPGGTQPTTPRPIVFVHLGDIYYSGLSVECRQNFFDVFAAVGQKLNQDATLTSQGFSPAARIFVLPGNHEYYSDGYGFFELVDALGNGTNLDAGDEGSPGAATGPLGPATGQRTSFFCLRTKDNAWQMLGMDTGQDDHLAIEPIIEKARDLLLPVLDAEVWALAIASLPPGLSYLVAYWVTRWLNEIVQNLVGPFAPKLVPSELAWHQQRLNELPSCQTLLLSHHQGFSSAVQIDHLTPMFLNRSLLKDFKPYFATQVAGWFWGHEHSWAAYQDGLFGLAKGRLLGGSAYEASEEDDDSYKVIYPEVLYQPEMPEPTLENGYYDHTAAILDFKRQHPTDPIQVTYYQYPSWGQTDAAPASAALTALYAETQGALANTVFKTTWHGNSTISGDDLQSGHQPALATFGDTLYLVWDDATQGTVGQIQWATCQVGDSYTPGSIPSWEPQGAISASKTTGGTSLLSTVHPLAAAAFGTAEETDPVILPDAPNGQPLLGGGPLPGATSNHFLLLVFVMPGTDTLQSAKYDPRSGTWQTDPNPITIAGKTLHCHAGPSLATFVDGVYMAYGNNSDKNSNGVPQLYLAKYDPLSGTWVSNGPLKINGNKQPCAGQPSLAANPSTLFVAYTTQNGTIFWSSYPLLDAQGKKNENPAWTSQAQIQIGKTTLQTNYGLSLAADQAYLYLVYTNDDANTTIYQALYNLPQPQTADHPGSPNPSQWWGGTAIVIGEQQGTAFVNPRSQTGPALVIGGEMALIAYLGQYQPRLYQAYL